jgi:hypothetical protein
MSYGPERASALCRWCNRPARSFAKSPAKPRELDPNLTELRVLRIRRQAMAARNRASLSAAKGLRTVLFEMAETYDRIAESTEQGRQALGPQS